VHSLFRAPRLPCAYGAAFGPWPEPTPRRMAFPQSWRDELAKENSIESFADQLFALSARARRS
jgi:hypothetical protein